MKDIEAVSVKETQSDDTASLGIICGRANAGKSLILNLTNAYDKLSDAVEDPDSSRGDIRDAGVALLDALKALCVELR